MKPCEYSGKLHINWCKISSINSVASINANSCVSFHCHKISGCSACPLIVDKKPTKLPGVTKHHQSSLILFLVVIS